MRDALKYGMDLLDINDEIEKRANVELMLSEIVGCKRNELLTLDSSLDDEKLKLFESYLERRVSGEPLQYILGETEFYGYRIKVDGNVLIPRPETEQLVERVLDDIAGSGKESVNILEIGTGSGCISIALAKELEKKNVECNITATDISEKALKLAVENISSNNARNVEVIVEDFLSIHTLDDYDYIVSNPPYISMEDFLLLDTDIKDHEPKVALTDKSDGLTFYRRMFALLKNKTYPVKLFCEIGYDQKEKLELLLSESNICEFKFHKDYNGIYRIMEVKV